MDVCGGPVLQRGGALRRINGRGLWRGEAKGEEGGVRATVEGCNQSLANTGTVLHTYIHTNAAVVKGLSSRPTPLLLPPQM